MNLIRSHNGGDWWPSVGPVKWVLRTIKLEAWYQNHAWCGVQVEGGDGSVAAMGAWFSGTWDTGSEFTGGDDVPF